MMISSSVLLTSFVLAQCVTRAVTQQAPHVIVFLVDDMGFNDVSWRDARMHTPNLQRLRDEGVELNQLYMLPKCTASRAAIMTGRYPYKTGLQSNSVFRHCKNNTMPLHLKTLPQYLKDFGYSTHAVGKWHLGFCNLSSTPTHRGFDSFYGTYMGSIDNYKLSFTKGEGGYDFHFNEVPDWQSKGHYTTDLLTKRTQNILREELGGAQKEKSPLFIYLAYTAVHDPIQSPARFIMQTKCRYIKDPYRRTYCAMLAAVDESVGNITATINDLGVSDDFVLLFASDNGGAWAHGASNYPLRGHKGTVFEGGTRVAAFIHSKKYLPRAPYTYNGLLHGVDIIPTLVGAAGGTVTDDLDGINAWSKLQQNVPSGRTEIVYNLDTQGEMGAIRHRNATSDFKLVYDRYERVNEAGCAGWKGEPPGVPTRPFTVRCKDYMLFDLSVDPEENNDVSSKFPGVLSKLKTRYEELKREERKMPFYKCFKESKPTYNGGAWTHGWC